MNTPTAGKQKSRLRYGDNEIEVLKTELQKSLKREQLTRHILQFVDHSLDTEYILRVIAREIGMFFEADRCLVVYYEDKDVNKSRILAQYCRSEDILLLRDEDVPWAHLHPIWEDRAVKNDQSLILLNFSDPEQFPESIQQYRRKYNIQSALSLEIRYRDIVFGRVVLHQCSHPRVWLESEVDFLHSLMPYIGSSLYQAELYRQELEAKREAEDANQKKTKILSYVSHDFKNPLDSMSRFVEILKGDKEGVLSPKQQEILHYFSEGIQLLRDIVTNILDRARLEDGEITPSPKWLNLSLFVEGLHFLFHAMVCEKNIHLHIEIQSSLRMIKIDPTHLKQLLINLISNAVKYNRPGGDIFLRFFEVDGEDCIALDVAGEAKKLLIEVQDTGIGIPEEKIPHLFTDYYRLNLAQPMPVEGTGLGLSFIKKLVELYQGSITVNSTVGVGSTFRVKLLLDQGDGLKSESI